ncbi:CHY zinc finger protein [Microbacterium sp. gxy059]|uniref:CHY zinc finger protein n=1 Tax=Microbacterium sp. gxy059 TaxID=2957199 RepID=UPI003D96BEFC
MSAGAPRRVGERLVGGAILDDETRCAHWHGPDDVLAILFPCCRAWFPCHACHEEAADHPAEVWPADAVSEEALLCGRCGGTTAIGRYRETSACARCGGAFNDGCRLHAHLYFA